MDEAGFWRRVIKTSGCWTWTGANVPVGYGRLKVDGHLLYAHRFSFALAFGPIPSGFVVDHECHNLAVRNGECDGGPCPHRLCVNPDHLALRSVADNVMASPLHNCHKTRCVHGHEYTELNTYVAPTGERRCRACATALARRKVFR